MTIREIELDNFRIYKGKNRIELFPDGNRNLVIVSGNNGFGKTTFLMSLVLQSPNQKIPDRKTKCVIKTHINIKQNVIFGAKLKPV